MRFFVDSENRETKRLIGLDSTMSFGLTSIDSLRGTYTFFFFLPRDSVHAYTMYLYMYFSVKIIYVSVYVWMRTLFLVVYMHIMDIKFFASISNPLLGDYFSSSRIWILVFFLKFFPSIVFTCFDVFYCLLVIGSSCLSRLMVYWVFGL